MPVRPVPDRSLDRILSEYAWWGGIHGDGNAKSEQYAHPVGQKKSNRRGLHDMHGNVWGWCRDIYVKELPGGADPEVTSGGSDRVLRGGGGYGLAWYCRSANRGWNDSSFRFDYLGFRLVPSRSAK